MYNYFGPPCILLTNNDLMISSEMCLCFSFIRFNNDMHAGLSLSLSNNQLITLHSLHALDLNQELMETREIADRTSK